MVGLERKQVVGKNWVRHFPTNVLIEPSGRLDIPEVGKPGSVYISGHSDDTYVKTAEGWRFKT
jgi:hypothetical protein